MMELLLDEHVTPGIALAARKLSRGIRIVSIHDWLDGHFVGVPDAEILREAVRRRVTFVTFDLKTIPLLLRSWAELGMDRGGVVFVDEKTFAQNDVGGMARALCELRKLQGNLDWTNRAFFLQPPIP
ncbi:MAG: hypothetical protein AAB676_10015 [Verrucomicrobiota bacterium]